MPAIHMLFMLSIHLIFMDPVIFLHIDDISVIRTNFSVAVSEFSATDIPVLRRCSVIFRCYNGDSGVTPLLCYFPVLQRRFRCYTAVMLFSGVT